MQQLAFKKDTPVNRQALIAPGRNNNTFAIYSEKLDFSLFNMMEAHLENPFNYPLIERLNFAIAAISGIEMLSEEFIHCDIKPENIMFKEIEDL